MPDQAPNIDIKPGGGRLVYDKERRTIVSAPNEKFAARAAVHAKLDDLAAQIKDAGISCENSYYTWTAACERLRQLEREHRKTWLSLLDDIAPPRS